MTQLVTQSTKRSAILSTLQSDGMMQQLRMACAKTITPERLARVAMTELRTNSKLAECSEESFYGALMQCAQLGLEPGTQLGLAYLIPRRGVVNFELGYKGLIALMWRSEMISSIQAEVVYEGDHFDYSNGIPPTLMHRPAENRDAAAKPTHAYCVIGTTTGGWLFRVMTYDEIEKIRKDHSKASRSDAPWVTAWGEMACKTVLKRTSKRAPISSEASRAIAIDDMAAVGLSQSIDPEIEIETPEPSNDAGGFRDGEGDDQAIEGHSPGEE